MQLDVVRSGGFANLRFPASLDTDELPRAEAQEIEALVGEIDLKSLAERSPLRGAGADRFQYELKVVRDGAEYRVIASESEVPPELRAVIDRVLTQGSAPGTSATGPGQGRP
ncbi:MAG: protealysin inhibitor emfourin [Thermoleophilaceae bacterium]